MNYRVATSPADYKKCHSLMTIKGEECPLSFPTIMAEDEEGEIVGFLSTHPRLKDKGLVVAGPLVLSERRPVVAFRLGEMYDLLMKSLDLVWFFATDDPDFAAQLKRLGYVVHQEMDGKIWFKNREVKDGQ